MVSVSCRVPRRLLLFTQIPFPPSGCAGLNTLVRSELIPNRLILHAILSLSC
jgi:hypothetical protein